jgi:hypothetical protein
VTGPRPLQNFIFIGELLAHLLINPLINSRRNLYHFIGIGFIDAAAFVLDHVLPGDNLAQLFGFVLHTRQGELRHQIANVQMIVRMDRTPFSWTQTASAQEIAHCTASVAQAFQLDAWKAASICS